MQNLEFYHFLSDARSPEAMKCEQLFAFLHSCTSVRSLMRLEREALQQYKQLGGDPVDFYSWYSGMSLGTASVH